MPCILKIRVISARDLPVMDKASELTDAYVEVRFADYEVQRTQICRKTLNPVWNSDFRIEVSNDADLQNEPVELRVLDYDTISSNDIVGLVSIDINPLLAWEASSTIDDSILNTSSASERQISGWFPLYDTLLGIRGEVNIQIKLQFFGDVNPFKDSSAGVCFFTSPSIPDGYEVENVFGLVEVLLNENDPEFSWADTFRAPRTSNESRQKLLYRLSGQLRRLLGREVLELAGNAVIGFKQYFDSETEGGILTGRAIGTCILLKARDCYNSLRTGGLESPLGEAGALSLLSLQSDEIEIPAPDSAATDDMARNLITSLNSDSPTINPHLDRHSPVRHSKQFKKGPSNATFGKQDSFHDTQSSHAIQAQITSPDTESVIFKGDPARQSLSRASDSRNLFQSPVDPVILTVHSFPPGVVSSIGGIVSAKSVKLYQGNETEVRKSWWWELREEVMGHAKTLGCQYVLGYSEAASFRDELCVLSAMGTAVNIDIPALTRQTMCLPPSAADIPPTVKEESPVDESPSSQPDISEEREESEVYPVLPEVGSPRMDDLDDYSTSRRKKSARTFNCGPCHVPYSDKNALFPMTLTRCLVCGRGAVPELIFSTTEIPPELDLIGKPQLLEAHVCRSKKKKEGESNAAIVSDSLPFIEYDLHRQLMYKLRLLGMNALFGCQFQLSIGEGWMVAVASGTAVYLAALPPPPVLKISRTLDMVDAENQRMVDIQRKLIARSDENHKIIDEARIAFMTKLASENSQWNAAVTDAVSPFVPVKEGGDVESEITSRQVRVQPKQGNEEAQQTTSIVVQVDDDADEDLMAVLLDPTFPDLFKMHNLTEVCPLDTLEACGRPSDSHGENVGKKVCHQMVTVIKEASLLSSTNRPNLYLSTLFHELYDSVRWIAHVERCVLTGISVDIDMPEEGLIHLRVNGMLTGEYSHEKTIPAEPLEFSRVELEQVIEEGSNPNISKRVDLVESPPTPTTPMSPMIDMEAIGRQKTMDSQIESIVAATLSSASHPFVEITPLSRLANTKTVAYLGRLSLHFVKEDLNLHHVYGNHYVDQNHLPETAVDDDLGRFVHAFMVDIQAIVRAHTIAMGGNAVVGYRIEHSEFRETVRNQAYGMVSIGGDVVRVEPKEDGRIVPWSEMISDYWETSHRKYLQTSAGR